MSVEPRKMRGATVLLVPAPNGAKLNVEQGQS